MLTASLDPPRGGGSDDSTNVSDLSGSRSPCTLLRTSTTGTSADCALIGPKMPPRQRSAAWLAEPQLVERPRLIHSELGVRSWVVSSAAGGRSGRSSCLSKQDLEGLACLAPKFVTRRKYRSELRDKHMAFKEQVCWR